MKISYVSTFALPSEKAVGVQIMNMCAAFAQAGVDVELLLPESRKSDDVFSFYGVPRVFSVTRVPGMSTSTVPHW